MMIWPEDTNIREEYLPVFSITLTNSDCVVSNAVSRELAVGKKAGNYFPK